MAALYCARPGLEILGEIGIDAVRRRSLTLCRKIVEESIARGFELSSPADPACRGGTVALNVPDAELVAQELLSRDVIVDYRPGFGIRIAPHFYSAWEECELCLDHVPLRSCARPNLRSSGRSQTALNPSSRAVIRPMCGTLGGCPSGDSFHRETAPSWNIHTPPQVP